MENNYFYRVSFYYEAFNERNASPEERYFSHNSYDDVKEYFIELRDKSQCEIIYVDQVEFGKNGNYIRVATYNIEKDKEKKDNT